MISSEDLTWFIELANRLHMTRTSERLGISQPALSHWLKKLEHNLGKPLFRRSKQGMELTEFGEKLKEQSSILQQNWLDFIQALDNDEKTLKARFRFGLHASVAVFALPTIYKVLGQKAPGIRLNLQHGLSRHILEDIISKRLDLGIVVNPTPHPDLIIKELYKDEVRVYSLNSKVKQRLIVHPGLFQSQELKLKLKNIPEEVIETDSLEVATHLALAGEGMALLPERVAQALAGNKLKPVGGVSVTDRHCLVYRPTLRETLAGQKLIEAIKEAKI
ncbi:MAG: LysR family transcriptional regulator [Bacteriovoracaceae bacterium]|nr:LysR family transcriptional regulator [Bacteriovoracaceae bacterium]